VQRRDSTGKSDAKLLPPSSHESNPSKWREKILSREVPGLAWKVILAARC